MCQSRSITNALKLIESFAEEKVENSSALVNATKHLVQELENFDAQIKLYPELYGIDNVFFAVLNDIVNNSKIYAVQDIQKEIDAIKNPVSDDKPAQDNSYSSKISRFCSNLLNAIYQFSRVLFYATPAALFGYGVGAAGAVVVGLPVAKVAAVAGVAGAVGGVTVLGLFSYLNAPKDPKKFLDKTIRETEESIKDFEDRLNESKKENDSAAVRYGSMS